MRRLVITLCATTALWAEADAGFADDRDAPPNAGKDIEKCAVVNAYARPEIYGYTHIVALTNGCDQPVVCEVWTNVDPAPRQTLRAAPGTTVEVVTRRTSPSREVSAEKSCRFE